MPNQAVNVRTGNGLLTSGWEPRAADLCGLWSSLATLSETFRTTKLSGYDPRGGVAQELPCAPPFRRGYAAAGRQVRRHSIEGSAQLAQFVLALDRDGLAEVAAADAFGLVYQLAERPYHQPDTGKVHQPDLNAITPSETNAARIVSLCWSSSAAGEPVTSRPPRGPSPRSIGCFKDRGFKLDMPPNQPQPRSSDSQGGRQFVAAGPQPGRVTVCCSEVSGGKAPFDWPSAALLRPESGAAGRFSARMVPFVQ